MWGQCQQNIWMGQRVRHRITYHFIFIFVWGASDSRVEVNARARLCRKKLLVHLYCMILLLQIKVWYNPLVERCKECCCKFNLRRSMPLRISANLGADSRLREISLSHWRQNKFGLTLRSSCEVWHWQHLWQSLGQATLAHFHLSSLKG